MASRSYTVPNRTPAIRKSVGERAKAGPSQKRKASTFSEVNTLGSNANTGRPLSSAKYTGKNKIADAEGFDEDNYVLATVECPRKKSRNGEPHEEKRLRAFRKRAPQSYLDRLERVHSQRMFLIDRERKFSADGSYEEEVFDIAGSTGNIYRVTIAKLPSCTCPDAKKGNQCKHIVYVCSSSLAKSRPCVLTDIPRYSSMS